MDEARAVAELVTRHRPGFEVRSVTALTAGTGGAAYDVNGELVVRLRTEADAAGVEREPELLATLAEHLPLPVPQAVFTDVAAGAIAVTRLPGVPLLGRTVRDPERLATTLGRFVRAVHRVPLRQVEALVPTDTAPLAEWREAAEDDYHAVASHLSPTEREAVERFLAQPLPDEPDATAFCHNDLGAEHVLVDWSTGEVTGVIDWSDAAVTDPVRDLARLYRDLGPQMFDLLVAHDDHALDRGARERARFYARCALVEDIAYGLGHAGVHHYAEIARANLARTFA